MASDGKRCPLFLSGLGTRSAPMREDALRIAHDTPHPLLFPIPNQRKNKAFDHTPELSPSKLERLVDGQMFLDGVVDPLDDHIVHPCLTKEIGQCWVVPKWIDGPASTWNNA